MVGSRYGWALVLHSPRFATDWWTQWVPVTNGNHGFLPMVFTQNNPGKSPIPGWIPLPCDAHVLRSPAETIQQTSSFCFVLVCAQKNVFSQNTLWKHMKFTMVQPQAAHFAFGQRGGWTPFRHGMSWSLKGTHSTKIHHGSSWIIMASWVTNPPSLEVQNAF